ncbi:MAG TPA: TetR/AcrR family transcriptional regulator [Devosiaceae bacterium]|jgi:AcrR family transcriptional regulator|nr:TetR/AcrR family transcriptional regulator [Devosiaceae bacterium]
MPRIVKTAGARRTEILDCARRLFASQGYDATSISQIIAAVGISKGAFYHHFAAKEDLLEGLAVHYAEEATGWAQEILEDSSLDSFARLAGFLDRLRRRKMESATDLRALEPVFRRENRQLYQRAQVAVAAVMQPILARIIAEGVAEQAFDTPDPDAAAGLILHLVSSTRETMAALYEAQTTEEAEPLLADLMRRFRYLGTVIDRMLGLPEGSIELADEVSLKVITAAWRPADRVA